MEKLLDIEQYCHGKFNKIKQNILEKVFDLLESHKRVGFYEGHFAILKPRVHEISILA